MYAVVSLLLIKVMQIPENPSNDDIRAALIQLREELGQKVVVVLSSLSPAVTAIITALYSANAH
jgi:hypothetical protein